QPINRYRATGPATVKPTLPFGGHRPANGLSSAVRIILFFHSPLVSARTFPRRVIMTVMVNLTPRFSARQAIPGLFSVRPPELQFSNSVFLPINQLPVHLFHKI